MEKFNIQEVFPIGYTPNPHQEKIIPKIAKAISSGKKYIIVSAPTGFGKSFIPQTLSRWAPRCSDMFKQMVLSYDAFRRSGEDYTFAEVCNKEPAFGAITITVNKALQEQYYNTFKPYISVFKGQTNYPCVLDDECRVDNAPCVINSSVKTQCWLADQCVYYKARNYACASQSSIMNYAAYFKLPSHVKRRKFLICDEASEIEEELVSNFTISIDYEKLEKLEVAALSHPPAAPHNQLIWLTDLLGKINAAKMKIEDQVSDKYVSQHKKKMLMDKLSSLNFIMYNIEDATKMWAKVEYVFETKQVPNKQTFVTTITPLHVDHIATRLFDNADHVVLMSATIIDPANYAKRLGITDYEYIEAPSTFLPSKSKIYLMDKFSINYQNQKDIMPKVANIVRQICSSHDNDKGIIHTHNFAITDILTDYLVEDRYLFRTDKQTNADILMEHFQSDEPTVLVSPSMTHGVDLKDHLARFQIIIKAPYLPLGNERIKKLFNIDKEWYQDKMLSTVIQACGRGVRSENDYCTTYIIDANILKSIKMNSYKLPKYFLKRIV